MHLRCRGPDWHRSPILEHIFHTVLLMVWPEAATGFIPLLVSGSGQHICIVLPCISP